MKLRTSSIIYLIFAMAICSQHSHAQVSDTASAAIKSTPVAPRIIVKKPKPITKESSGGFRLHTDGWSVFYESGRAKSSDMKRIEQFHDTRIFQVEFSERRHPKEIRMFGWDINKESSKKYAFAKMNNFYALKFNIGNR
ncbi:MAG: hypothetical protein IT256_07710, partial [Chitinophagaceae bacterium]|nr:hypothetical protein [Chitinophagaceae bacterium]